VTEIPDVFQYRKQCLSTFYGKVLKPGFSFISFSFVSFAV